MSLHSPQKFLSDRPEAYDGYLDFDKLSKYLPAKITPMDFDAVIERRGHFLVIEKKRVGIDIPLGQQICLLNFSKLPNCSVLTIQADPGEEALAMQLVSRGEKHRIANPSWDSAAILTKKFWDKAEGK